MIQDIDIRVKPAVAAQTSLLRDAVAKVGSLKPEAINDLQILRRSIDARQRNVMVNLRVRVATDADKSITVETVVPDYKNVADSAHTLVIVGAGPAGLFAALRCLELGIKPIIVERGKDVDSRRKDIAAISREGRVDSDSNYCFGEGGAGTFSDGKLFTRSKKRGNVEKILHLLHYHGGSADLLVDAHPHIGSDRLPVIIKDMRETIIRHGGEVRFSTRMVDLIVEAGEVRGIVTECGDEIRGSVVLATGHSARDVYRLLHSKGVELQAKGLAIGVRLEHPQRLIDKIQYHSPEGRGKWLPAAEYSFVEQVDGRGVYSFCMCPGGVIVPAVSASGESVVNGMSSSARSGRWSNSGMVVEVRPGDIAGYSQYGELEMLQLQVDLEKRYYAAAGDTLKAPAQRMADFVSGKRSAELNDSSYPPGLIPAPVHEILPPHIATRLREGFKKMGAKSRGFLTNEATLVGLESRTSSPVRVPRDGETMQHISVKGLYPAGEGAGYAGGIVSAAIDGVRCAEAFAKSLEEKQEGI